MARALLSQGRGCAPAGIRRALSAYVGFFSWLVRRRVSRAVYRRGATYICQEGCRAAGPWGARDAERIAAIGVNLVCRTCPSTSSLTELSQLGTSDPVKCFGIS